MLREQSKFELTNNYVSTDTSHHLFSHWSILELNVNKTVKQPAKHGTMYVVAEGEGGNWRGGASLI